jgi:hypothetical protein
VRERRPVIALTLVRTQGGVQSTRSIVQNGTINGVKRKIEKPAANSQPARIMSVPDHEVIGRLGRATISNRLGGHKADCKYSVLKSGLIVKSLHIDCVL